MEKVYLVIETYEFDGVENETTVFSTFGKAKEFFDKVVEREKTQSWIADLEDDEMDEVVDENDYYHVYDPNDYYSTKIYIEEKEIG